MHRMHIKWLILAVFILFGKVAIASNSYELSRLSNQQTKGAVNTVEYRFWTDFNIRVCWEFTAMPSRYEEERRLVRTTIANTWSAHSDLEFTYWGACRDDYTERDSIRITVEDRWPRARLGRAIAGVRGGLRLNFDFVEWTIDSVYSNAGWNCRASRQNRLFCIESSAIHEFGHALGFLHEETRADTPQWCIDRMNSWNSPIVSDIPENVGPWDATSVMGRCHPQRSSASNRLSMGDVSMVNRFYSATQYSPEYDDVPLFNAYYYMLQNPDVARVAANNRAAAKYHWDVYGQYEGRASSPSYSVKQYRELNGDLRSLYGENWAAYHAHFKQYGAYEGRQANYAFDAKAYLDLNPDVADRYGQNNYRLAHFHWSWFGVSVGRQSAYDFDVVDYLSRYPDLQQAYGSDNYWSAVAHYVRSGRNEGRIGNSDSGSQGNNAQTATACSGAPDYASGSTSVSRGFTTSITLSDVAESVSVYDNGSGVTASVNGNLLTVTVPGNATASWYVVYPENSCGQGQLSGSITQ